MHLFDFWCTPVIAGIAPNNIQFVIGGIMQCAAILIVLYMICRDAVGVYDRCSCEDV